MVWLLARKPSVGRIVAIATLINGMLLRGWLWRHEVAPFMDVLSEEGNFLDRYIGNIYNPTYARLDGLLAGVMLAVVKGFWPAWWSWAMARRLRFLIAGFGRRLVYASMCPKSPGYASVMVGFPLLSVSLASIVLVATGPQTGPGRLRIPVAPLAAMGFSLYLNHKSAFHSISGHLGTRLEDSKLLEFCVYVGAALAVGALLYLAVERPCMRLRERFLTRGKDDRHLRGANDRIVVRSVF